jgi:hypothetical protein
MTMAEGSYALSEESIRLAEEGIRGMINATGGATITSYVMIEAALHILAAWVASSQATSSTAEREADIKDLLELLPECIAYHRIVRWLPDPHRMDH